VRRFADGECNPDAPRPRGPCKSVLAGPRLRAHSGSPCNRPIAPILAATLAILAVAACSRPAPNGSRGAVASARMNGATMGNACDRHLVTKADVAPLLSEGIATIKPIPGDLQSCEFTTTGFSSIQVALRPGLGKLTIDQILSGGTNETVTALAGVGDRAVWDATLKEVNAEKNGVLCDIGAIGPATGAATEEKIGALCNKIFAAS
jgi:hypothetical protein